MLEQAYHFLSVFLLQHHCHLIISMFDVLQYLFVQVHWWALVTLMMNSKWCYHILHSKGTNHRQIRLKWVIRVSFVKVVGRNVKSECDVNCWNRNTLSVWSSDLDAMSNSISIPHVSHLADAFPVICDRRASGWPACQSHSICCVLNFWLACCCKWRMYLWGWLRSSWVSYEREELICTPLKIHFTHFR